MARRRKGRNVNGIILLDKPLHFSSNDALQKVRGIFRASKAGHTGALDPLATGMLPICLGEATKFSQFLLDSDKTYQVTATLGVRTTTSDADGEVVETRPVNLDQPTIEKVCQSYQGHSKQVPSMFSALKYQGKPLYHYARQGIEIDREARDIVIHALVIDAIRDNEIDMTVRCSKGTYIRSLVDDIGQDLGCGAYVSRLHRSQVAGYPEDKVYTIEQLQALRDTIPSEHADALLDEAFQALDDLLLPMDSAVDALHSVVLDDNAIVPFCNGNPVPVTNGVNHSEGIEIRVYAKEQARFLGVARIDNKGHAAPKRLVNY